VRCRPRPALARGVREVVVSEPHPKRRELAERLGATVVTPDELHTPDFPSTVVDAPFDVALECSGAAAAMEQCLGQLKRAGTLVLVGAGMRRPKFDNNRILMNELVITGAFVYDDGGFDDALALLAVARLPDRRADRAERRATGGPRRRDPGSPRGRAGCQGDDLSGGFDMTTTKTRKPRFKPRGDERACRPARRAGPYRSGVVLRGGLRLAGDPPDDRGPEAARAGRAHHRAVRVPDRGRPADDRPAARPLRAVGRDRAGARRHPRRAKAYQEKDDRVDIVDKKTDDHGMLAITSIYIGYLLPMMVEIQWWDYKGSDVEQDG
jgi:hypothetical protein